MLETQTFGWTSFCLTALGGFLAIIGSIVSQLIANHYDKKQELKKQKLAFYDNVVNFFAIYENNPSLCDTNSPCWEYLRRYLSYAPFFLTEDEKNQLYYTIEYISNH